MSKGWEHLPEVKADEENWPLAVAASLFDMSLRDLRDLVRIAGLEPSGTAKMAAYSRQGRQPRVYPARRLLELHEAIYGLKRQWTDIPDL